MDPEATADLRTWLIGHSSGGTLAQLLALGLHSYPNPAPSSYLPPPLLSPLSPLYH